MNVYAYTSAFGVYVIPPEVQARADRLARLYGRRGYLDDWCRWQWQKAPTQ